ncbi:iron-siderophore ABC transporter substrate-binding protein [Yimella sp. cx-573]|nr:iron-siderophore ABC transporter substrate-binding protein [Yimella sp. cx-573]
MVISPRSSEARSCRLVDGRTSWASASRGIGAIVPIVRTGSANRPGSAKTGTIVPNHVISPKASRRSLLALTVVAGLTLTACGDSSDSSSGAPGNTDVAKGGSQFSVADAETAKLGSDERSGVFLRTVKHANGTTEIKAKPKRVVVLDTGELDDVVSLGITPVGIPATKGANSIPSYLAGKVSGAKTVGTIQEPNLEAIAALKPDLILGSKLCADKLYPQLSQIAPTVFSIRPGFPWKENFTLVGEALGMETHTVSTLNAYQSKADNLKKATTGDPKISLVRFMPGKIRLYANKSLIGVILKDAGLARPANQNVDDLAVEISAEKISEAGGGDFLFYTSYGKPAATGKTSVISGTQWKNLPAVRNGKAIRVNDDVWFLGLGPTGAGLVLDDLAKYLTPKK